MADRRTALTLPRRGRLGRLPRRPDLDAGHNPHRIGQFQGRQRITPGRIAAIGRIGQHRAAHNTCGMRSMYLRQRYFRLGGERDLLRNTGLLPLRRIGRPSLRKIQPKGHRHARRRRRQRYAHCHLAVVLLADLPAVLSGHADRMLALLAKNPCGPRSSTPRPSTPFVMRRTDGRAPAPPHQTNPTWPRNGATLDAEPVSAADPDAPPAAPRFCAPTAASIHGNNRVSPPPDRHNQAQRIAHPDRRKKTRFVTDCGHVHLSALWTDCRITFFYDIVVLSNYAKKFYARSPYNADDVDTWRNPVRDYDYDRSEWQIYIVLRHASVDLARVNQLAEPSGTTAASARSTAW